MRIDPDKIIEWVKRNFTYKSRKNGAELTINSPFTYDTGYNFNISPAKGCCHDWRSDDWCPPDKNGKRSKSFVKFVMLYKNMTFAQAVKDITGSEYYISTINKNENIEKLDIKLPDAAERLCDADDMSANILKNWLKTRGYNDKDIAKNDLHYCGMNVYWLYYEYDEFVYWQSRSRINKQFLFPNTQEYDSSGNIIAKTDVGKGDYLYGFDDAKIESYIILTEAIFDQHTIGEQALATGGATVTENQIKKIKLLSPKHGVILAPDNDNAGIKSVISNYKLLKGNYSVYYSLPPKIEYVKDGIISFTKDFNELYQYCKISKDDIRKIFDDNIRLINPLEFSKLLSMVNK